MKLDDARVFDDGARDNARTHVLIIGVGHYRHGDEGDDPTLDGSGLAQLTSPPKSAVAVAEWFINEFRNPDHPLGTVTMLVSDIQPMVLETPLGPRTLPDANWENVRASMTDWKELFQTHPGNMLVFYFCGHGISLGQRAALLLSDFANRDNPFEPAIDIDALCGTLRNAQPGKQVFIVDCCRTKADSIYVNQNRIGGQALSVSSDSRRRDALVRQFLLFPSIDGQKAFGVPGEVSVFTSCFLDAVKFAGFDDTTGKLVSTTSLIFNAVDRLVSYRLPTEMLGRTVPTAMNSASFEFNHIADPMKARSVVTIDPSAAWPDGEFTASCVNDATLASQKQASSQSDPYRCCVFEVEYGRWEFAGDPDVKPPLIVSAQQTVTRPVAYVKLEVK